MTAATDAIWSGPIGREILYFLGAALLDPAPDIRCRRLGAGLRYDHRTTKGESAIRP